MKPTSRKKVHTRAWFRGHVPCSWEGWLVTSFLLVLIIPALESIMAIDRATHSASDTFYASFFYLAFIALDFIVLNLICKKTRE